MIHILEELIIVINNVYNPVIVVINIIMMK